MTMQSVKHFDPTKGQAFQGDVMICAISAAYARGLCCDHEIKAMSTEGGVSRLILQEGEVTGHHHAIRLPGFPQPTMFRDDALARDLEARVQEPVGTARMFRDDALSRQLVRSELLTRSDLVVGYLVVAGGSVVLSHEEHDSIRIPEGVYLIGRQVESAGAEERIVAD